jgi:hypothetical protein
VPCWPCFSEPKHGFSSAVAFPLHVGPLPFLVSWIFHFGDVSNRDMVTAISAHALSSTYTAYFESLAQSVASTHGVSQSPGSVVGFLPNISSVQVRKLGYHRRQRVSDHADEGEEAHEY